MPGEGRLDVNSLKESDKDTPHDFTPSAVIKVEPYSSIVAQELLKSVCCGDNPGFQIHFVDRDEWERFDRGGAILTNDAGQCSLYIPKDLHLWEIQRIVEIAENDTYSDRPEKKGKFRHSLKEIAQTLKDISIFLAQHMDGEAQSNDFVNSQEITNIYAYAQALENGKPPKDNRAELSAIRKQTVFDSDRAAACVVDLKNSLKKLIAQPQVELEKALFEKALWKMLTEMGRHIPDFDIEPQSIFNQKIIEKFQSDLNEAKRTKNVEKIAQAQLDICRAVAVLINSIKKSNDAPTRLPNMLREHHISCGGATALGGMIMRELDIPYAVASVMGTGSSPMKHAILLVVTADNKLHFQDMTIVKYADEVKAEKFLGNNSGSPSWAAIDDIKKLALNSVRFSSPSTRSVLFQYKHGYYMRGLFDEDEILSIKAHTPDVGHFRQFLDWESRSRGYKKSAEHRLEALKRLSAIEEHDADNKMTKILALVDAGKTDEAIALGEEIIAQYNEEALAFYWLGYAYYAANKYPEALKAMTKGGELDPSDSDYDFMIGMILTAMKHKKEAVVAFERGLNKAAAHQKSDFYVRLVNLDPTNPLWLGKLGAIRYEDSFKVDEKEVQPFLLFAERCLQKAIELDDKNLENYYNLAKVKARLGKNEEAIDLFKKYYDLSETFHTDTFYYFAKACECVGDQTSAIRNYKNFIEATKKLGKFNKKFKLMFDDAGECLERLEGPDPKLSGVEAL